MRQSRRTLGIIILLLVFIVIFSITAIQYGFIDALKAWGVAVALVCAIVFGARLTVG